MTRWARAGNTRKHCKQPEDPTPWEDFAAQLRSKKNRNEKFKSGKVKKHTNISKRSVNNPKFLRLQAKNAETGETTYSKSTKIYVDLKKEIESQLVKDNIAPNSVSIKRNMQQVEDYGNASQAHANDVEEGIPVMPSVSEENESIDMLSQIDKKYSSEPQQKWKNNKSLTLKKNDLKLMIHDESPHGNGKTANNFTRKFQVCSPQQKEQSMVCEDTVQEPLNDLNKSENTKMKKKKVNRKNPDCVSHQTGTRNKSEAKLKNNETIVSKKVQVKCNEDSNNIEYKNDDILKLHEDLNISLCEEGNFPSPKPEKKLNAISKKKKNKVALGIEGRKKRRVDPCSISVPSAEIIEHADSNQNDTHCNDLSKVVNNFDESDIKVDTLVQERLNDVGKNKNTKIKRKKGNKKNKNNPDCVSHETIREDKPQTKFKNNETIASKKAQVKCNEELSNIEYKNDDILKLHEDLNIFSCKEGNFPLPKPEKKLNAISKKKKNKMALGIEGRKKRRVDPCSISGSSAEIIEHADSNQNDPYCNDLSKVVNNFDESGIKDDRLLANDASEKKNSKEIKRNIFLQKRQQKRAENGITLLSPKIENKLLRIKNAMRKKGLSGERIKEVIRYERRKEELKFKKIKNKMCFNCREFGHKVADCPKTATDNEQGTGICFKCGSTEHTSHKCSIKNSDFPFAKCFICQNMGHLSRHCAQNKHGIYPKGGKCNLCGDINHLKKDCPKLSKVKEQMEVTAETMDVVTSVDAEIEEAKPIIKRGKTVKIVKFRH